MLAARLSGALPKIDRSTGGAGVPGSAFYCALATCLLNQPQMRRLLRASHCC
jgi:hypothetical protein